jgi:activating signal cointegrator complex subunit 3
MPITDILQMVGRAGRPQYNDKGFACVYVEKSKKNFYRKYLNDPFPIESRLITQLAEHLNAEINSGTITNKQNCMDYLTWTYWFRRITRNPLFYEIPNNETQTIQKHIIDLIDKTCIDLKDSGTIGISEDGFELSPTFLGHLASSYYIQHKSTKFIASKIKEGLSIYQLIEILSHCEEYDEVPMRHNEENLNAALASLCRYQVDKNKYDCPKVKTLLLFQAYFSGLPLPIRDYITDTKLVLDSSVRFLQAMIDLTAERGHLDTLLNLMSICQMLTQGCWSDQSSLLNIPHFSEFLVKKLKDTQSVEHLCQVIHLHNQGSLKSILKSLDSSLTESKLKDIEDCIKIIPDAHLKAKLFDFDSEEMAPVLKEGVRIKSREELYAAISVRRHNHQHSLKVNMKKLTKVKDFSWWILVCNLEENRVFSLKKTFFKTTLHREFQFSLSNKKSTKVDIMLISDSFIGIDQVVTIDLGNYLTQEPPKPKTAAQKTD